MDMEISNWSRYQHYKDRCPPWIKLHTRLLNDAGFCALSQALRGLLIQLWILASERNGVVNCNLQELRFRLRDGKIVASDVEKLVGAGFLVPCKQTQADASERYSETERERETETDNTMSARADVALELFEELWTAALPYKDLSAGAWGSKVQALVEFKAVLRSAKKAGVDPKTATERIIAALRANGDAKRAVRTATPNSWVKWPHMCRWLKNKRYNDEKET